MNIIPTKLTETISSLQRWLHTVIPLSEKVSPFLVMAKMVAKDYDKLYFLYKELSDLFSSYSQLKDFVRKRMCVDAVQLDGSVMKIKL